MGIEKLMDVYGPRVGRKTEGGDERSTVADKGALSSSTAIPAGIATPEEVVPDLGESYSAMPADHPGPSSPEPLARWQDSAPVMRLSEHLKRCRPHGITICVSRDGIPALRFDPGLRAADLKEQTPRGQAAFAALGLLQDAVHDLSTLLAGGMIDLPLSKKGA